MFVSGLSFVIPSSNFPLSNGNTIFAFLQTKRDRFTQLIGTQIQLSSVLFMDVSFLLSNGKRGIFGPHFQRSFSDCLLK